MISSNYTSNTKQTLQFIDSHLSSSTSSSYLAKSVAKLVATPLALTSDVLFSPVMLRRDIKRNQRAHQVVLICLQSNLPMESAVQFLRERWGSPQEAIDRVRYALNILKGQVSKDPQAAEEIDLKIDSLKVHELAFKWVVGLDPKTENLLMQEAIFDQVGEDKLAYLTPVFYALCEIEENHLPESTPEKESFMRSSIAEAKTAIAEAITHLLFS